MTVVVYRKRNIAFGQAVPSNVFSENRQTHCLAVFRLLAFNIIFPITSQANLKTFTHNSTLPETMRISGNLLSVIKNLLHAACKRFLIFHYVLYLFSGNILDCACT